MNVERMLAVADAIERHEIEWLGFNMGSYCHSSSTPSHDRPAIISGTVACLAGWTTTIALNAKNGEEVKIKTFEHFREKGLSTDPYFGGIHEIAQAYLGLSEGEAYALFLPDISLGTRTHCEGAMQLRRAALTGNCEWPKDRRDGDYA